MFTKTITLEIYKVKIQEAERKINSLIKGRGITKYGKIPSQEVHVFVKKTKKNKKKLTTKEIPTSRS